jgi:hypothetical protein
MMRVRILGREYILKPGTAEELRGRWGFIDANEQKIRYADHIANGSKREAVFHELMHAADMMTANGDDEVGEGQVQRVSAVLFAILRDHPDLVKWLMDESLVF